MVSPEASQERSLEILLVEDDPAQVAAYRAIAKRHGLNLQITGRTTEVFRLALAQRPDLVLMDLNLEDGLSTKVLHTLRDSPETKEIPVAMVSAHIGDPRVDRALQQTGASALLAKPWNVDELLDLIGQLTGRRPTASIRGL